MTDKDIEILANKMVNAYLDFDDNEDKASYEVFYEGYITGAKEMLKENAISERIIIGEQMEIDRLEKENRELKLLKEKMETWINRIRELKEENEQLKAQNKKMKCCGNCKHCDSDNPCRFHRENRQCDNYGFWELAE